MLQLIYQSLMFWSETELGGYLPVSPGAGFLVWSAVGHLLTQTKGYNFVVSLQRDVGLLSPFPPLHRDLEWL